MFEAVGADELTGLRDLLDGQESRVDTPVIGHLVLLFDDGQQDAFRFLERKVLLFLDDTLQLVEGVDGDDVPASSQNLLDGIKAVGSTLFLIVGLDEISFISALMKSTRTPGLNWRILDRRSRMIVVFPTPGSPMII